MCYVKCLTVVQKLMYRTGERGREVTAVKVLGHPAHSSGFASSYFSLFLHLKQRLPGKDFHEKVNSEVTMCLRGQSEELCDFGVQDVVSRIKKIPRQRR
jgi:hypothetical protein